MAKKIKSPELLLQQKNNKIDFGSRVVAGRLNKDNMTREKLSDVTHIPYETLKKIELGKVMTSIDNMKKISIHIKVSTDSLTSGMTYKYYK